MSVKPDDIPQDVWDAADATVSAVSGDLAKCLMGETDAPADGLIHPRVARAILAERERCAIVARSRGREIGEPAVGNHIAKAILAPDITT